MKKFKIIGRTSKGCEEQLNKLEHERPAAPWKRGEK